LYLIPHTEKTLVTVRLDSVYKIYAIYHTGGIVATSSTFFLCFNANIANISAFYAEGGKKHYLCATSKQGFKKR